MLHELSQYGSLQQATVLQEQAWVPYGAISNAKKPASQNYSLQGSPGSSRKLPQHGHPTGSLWAPGGSLLCYKLLACRGTAASPWPSVQEAEKFLLPHLGLFLSLPLQTLSAELFHLFSFITSDCCCWCWTGVLPRS